MIEGLGYLVERLQTVSLAGQLETAPFHNPLGGILSLPLRFSDS
jgi:hypothetical protein